MTAVAPPPIIDVHVNAATSVEATERGQLRLVGNVVLTLHPTVAEHPDVMAAFYTRLAHEAARQAARYTARGDALVPVQSRRVE